jgi:hypothetical protein
MQCGAQFKTFLARIVELALYCPLAVCLGTLPPKEFRWPSTYASR